MTTGNIYPLPFKGDLIDYLNIHGREIEWLWRDGHAFIPVRPVCEVLDLSFQPQHRKLTAPEYRGRVTKMVTHDTTNRRQEMLCLAYPDFMMWLATISPSRVKPEAREPLIRLLDEIKLLIATHFEERWFGEVSGRDMALWKLKAEWVDQRKIRGIIERAERDGLDWFALKAMKGSMPLWMLVQEIREAMFFGVIDKPPKGTPMHLQQPRPKVPEPDERQPDMFAEG